MVQAVKGDSRWPSPRHAPSSVGAARRVLACCVLLGWSYPAESIDTLVVGQGVRNYGWRNIADWGYVERVTVSYDSLYKWDVVPHGNLGPGTLTRAGYLTATWEEPSGDSLITVSRQLPDLAFLVDGDAATAFDPDQSGAPRDMRIDVDLAGSFGVDRMVLFPRLDHEHRLLFPQMLTVSTSESSCGSEEPFIAVSALTFNTYAPNAEPVLDRQFTSRTVRCVRLQMDPVRSWELAELEVYSDGSLPVGEFQSRPLPAGNAYPVWGRVWYDGGDVSQLPVTIQTRTGPDRWPIQYFARTGVGDDLRVVSPGLYNALPEEEQGPVRANPDWSPWATVTNGVIRSPGLVRYLQFRISLPEPGTVIRQLGFEYAQPPLVQELSAEIDPRLVEAGEENTFTLSMVAYMYTVKVRKGGSTETRLVTSDRNTGFRRIDVLTAAQVAAVERVLVDDLAIPFTVLYRRGEGFTLNLGRRITQDASFIQIVFRGAVYRDGVRFEARAVDRRLVEGRLETAYHVAAEADIDARSPGGGLVVRLERQDADMSVLANLTAAPRSFSPNGDGVNDVCRISHDLLRLTRQARVTVQIHDLTGRIVRRLQSGEASDGHHTYPWDGCDDEGAGLPPGLYVYHVRMEADGRHESGTGVIGVVY